MCGSDPWLTLEGAPTSFSASYHISAHSPGTGSVSYKMQRTFLIVFLFWVLGNRSNSGSNKDGFYLFLAKDLRNISLNLEGGEELSNHRYGVRRSRRDIVPIFDGRAAYKERAVFEEYRTSCKRRRSSNVLDHFDPA